MPGLDCLHSIESRKITQFEPGPRSFMNHANGSLTGLADWLCFTYKEVGVIVGCCIFKRGMRSSLD